MDLKELTAFQTIVQEGTFSRAAEKLNYAQSTITNQIRRLEKELGVQLFKRGWDAQLTGAGQLFAAEVDSLLQHWNGVAELARALEHDEIGLLRIGGIETAIDAVLPRALRKFERQKPRMACRFVAGNTDNLTQALLDDELDFAVCGEPSDPAAFYFEPLGRERTVFIADREHPLHRRTEVSFSDLLNYPVIAGGRTCLYYLQLMQQLSRYKASPLLHTVSRISAIPYFVQHTHAVGVVLASTPLIPEVERIDAQLEMPPIPIGLLQLRGRSEPAESSMRLFQNAIKEEFHV
ncbi:LysR family transcriptional regulator [Paenibacillus lycopersici]|uniref:LysR family transcriptional regulator n=1 Tax=Paenibacillus lycopersici TaxID=2704462 RepID=A0A6C0G4P9_9BACL|nr:LysR family transcriptional regulator [Paenibacillus lycopersici]QHT63183.1 LysR family transcriptional regulator [Paenibacillus lycopersici]